MFILTVCQTECPSVTCILCMFCESEHITGVTRGCFCLLVSPLVWRGTQEFMCVTDRATQGTEAMVLGQYKQESCQHGAGARASRGQSFKV